MFADDTAVLAPHTQYEIVSTLQTAASSIAMWAQKWKINLNSLKSV